MQLLRDARLTLGFGLLAIAGDCLSQSSLPAQAVQASVAATGAASMHPQIQAAMISAIVALSIAGAPALWRWIRPGRLEIDVYDFMAVSTSVGLPRVHLHITARNAGGRSIRVKRWSMQIAPRDGAPFDLKGLGYFEKFNDRNHVLLTPMELQHNAEWTHSIVFARFLTRMEEAQLRDLQLQLREDIIAKRAALPDGAPPVRGDEQFWRPTVTFFDAHFRWVPGEYTATLEAEVGDKGMRVRKAYSFVLFEADTRLLRAVSEDYPYGWGLFLAQSESRPSTVFPQLTSSDR